MPGSQELVVIAVVALFVLGPDRLPDMARRLGRIIARIRHEVEVNFGPLRDSPTVKELTDEIDRTKRQLGVTQRPSGQPPRSRAATTLSGDKPRPGPSRTTPREARSTPLQAAPLADDHDGE